MFKFAMNSPNSISEMADWIELHLTSNKTEVSKSEINSLVEAAQGQEPEEAFIDSIWNELERRKLLYGENAPFSFDGQRIKSGLNWEDKPFYLTCLIFSIFGNSENPVHDGKIFERISNEAVKKYLNTEDTIIYGFPSIMSFPEIISKMNERFQFAPPSNFQDRGVDIIAWKSFKDERSSQIIILFQCAAGHNWRNKTTDIPLDAWKNYVCWGAYLTRGFCLPKIMMENEFEPVSYEAGILIDRARIFRNLDIGVEEPLKQEITNWCTTKLREYSEE